MTKKKKQQHSYHDTTGSIRPWIRLIAVVLIVGINHVGLLGVGETVGYYLDIETSTENTFQAGSVDFSLATSTWNPDVSLVSLEPGNIAQTNITVDPQNSNPFQYHASSSNISGDADFCNALQVLAALEGEPVYDGALVELLTDATTTLDFWEFTVGMGSANFQNSVCHFSIDYNGWQTRHNYPDFENGGYSDTETTEHWIASWGFRINKVYYDVDPDRGNEGENEWVEVYNQTNVPLDISGWEICDNHACDSIPSTAPIPPMGYALITGATTTASSTLPAFWYLGDNVIEVILSDGEIGNGLGNDADMLLLKRPDGLIVDQMNWGTPSDTWNNYNEHVWDPGVPDVAQGNVLARVPNGFDTDMPSDWSELTPPSVDLIYPDEDDDSQVWYWGTNESITWTATNNNGADGDLDINIFYIKDINRDGVISEGDSKHVIAETTNNDGLFDWIIPSGFLGYIWVHLVATGPENPMMNDATVSGRIYDPIPLLLVPQMLEESIEAYTSSSTASTTDQVIEEPQEEALTIENDTEEHTGTSTPAMPDTENQADSEEETHDEEENTGGGDSGGGTNTETDVGTTTDDGTDIGTDTGTTTEDGTEDTPITDGETPADTEDDSTPEVTDDDPQGAEEPSEDPAQPEREDNGSVNAVEEEEEGREEDAPDATEEDTETDDESEAEEEEAVEPEPEPDPEPESIPADDASQT